MRDLHKRLTLELRIMMKEQQIEIKMLEQAQRMKLNDFTRISMDRLDEISEQSPFSPRR